MSLMPPDLAKRIAEDYIDTELGGYRVKELHRPGGTSVVLIGETENGQRVAIKIYSQELFNGSNVELERINRQVENKHLEHPNVVRTHGAGVCPERDYHFLVMDFVNDPTITELVDELTPDEIRLIIEQVAGAALFIHEAMELVHRDIKPDNVAVRRPDNHVTLLDLGLVRPIRGSTVTDQLRLHVRATKRYAPPELIDNTVEPDQDGWLAVTFYQLGATLYEMLTCERPFEGYDDDDDTLFRAIREVNLTIDSPNAPPDLVKLSLDCLTKNPTERLSLVNWHRFLNAPYNAPQIGELSELLKSLPKSVAPTNVFPDGAEESHRRKKVHANISNEVELSIRSFLSGKEHLFPNYTVDRWQEVETDDEFVFVVKTDFADLAKPIDAYSVIWTKITDTASRSCVCQLSTSTNKPEAPLDLSSARVVYKGTFVQAEYKRTIGNELAGDLAELLGDLK